jgi:hypothetical protein
MVGISKKPSDVIRDKLDDFSMEINGVYRSIDYSSIRKLKRGELVSLRRRVIANFRGYLTLEETYLNMKGEHHSSYNCFRRRVRDISTCIERELMLRFPSLN